MTGANIFSNSAFVNGRVSQSEIDEIKQIMQDVYQYDAGNLARADNEDEKLLVKLDWNINDDLRLLFITTTTVSTFLSLTLALHVNH